MNTLRRGLVVGLVLVLAGAASAVVRLPRIIGSNMVLQADKPLPIWGWAAPGEKVTVTLAGQSKEALPDAVGKWKVVLDKMPAGQTPLKMTVKGANEIVLENILVGEVWLGSGQSNMQWSVGGSTNARQEIAAANYPKVRLFLAPLTASLTPADDIAGQWVECTPATVRDFSACLYFFGRTLHQELKTPVGLIATSWGGTLIEPWTPLAALESQPEFKTLADKAKAAAGPAPAPTGQPRAARATPRNQEPTVLFNAMINPFVPFAIRGAIWYQGESNVMQGDGMLYLARMKALIGGWRQAWGQDEFPFLFVQLAPWTGYKEGELPKVWQAQVESLKIPNTGMAVVTDITGPLNDIHPKDKQNVGKRLALWALAKSYGKSDLVYSGPMYKAMEVKDGKVVLAFDHVGGGLKSRDGAELSEFTVAGADRKFVPAKAKIEGDKVVVWSDGVSAPAAVRFGWHKTCNPNLSNAEGLPASPFRTDAW